MTKDQRLSVVLSGLCVLWAACEAAYSQTLFEPGILMFVAGLLCGIVLKEQA